MARLHSTQRPALRLVGDSSAAIVGWSWFCGRCAAPAPSAKPPAPDARVCTACGLGLLLESRRDLAPTARDAFLVIDSTLLVQAVSRHAETLLGVTEELGKPANQTRARGVGNSVIDAAATLFYTDSNRILTIEDAGK